MRGDFYGRGSCSLSCRPHVARATCARARAPLVRLFPQAVAGKPVELSLYRVVLESLSGAASRVRFDFLAKVWYGATVNSVAMDASATLLAVGGEAKMVRLMQLPNWDLKPKSDMLAKKEAKPGDDSADHGGHKDSRNAK
eukprot:6127157-Pleurochrysis_carterae.AAC.1